MLIAAWLSPLVVSYRREAFETKGRRLGDTASGTGREGPKSQRKRKVSFS
jgi:hypothetical protein